MQAMATQRRKKNGVASSVLPRPRVKLWLEYNGRHVFCSGMCQILEAVAQHGSIKEAAVAVEKSYRFVWAKIKNVEGALGQKVVKTQVGGLGTRRSALTPLGEQLVRQFRAVRRRVIAAVDGVSENPR
jgi:molybdate transport system regulatory protein